MNPDVLEKVLVCRDLPSLPAVASRVVELTQKDQVSFKELAETIQNDQALAAKILRTVNSSLFGLRKRCSSINQAIVMLGLSAVKSLALGFSLVGAIKDSAGESFDMAEYWRRALYTGVAAKNIAALAGVPNQEECFLGGLLQDVGMVALHKALGRPYLAAIAEAGGDHRKVAECELAAFQVQHSDIGALLAQRWKLPEELVMPIKYHERPTAAPGEHSAICRAVGLGNIAAELMVAAEPGPVLRRFYEKAEQWFAIDQSNADEVLKAIGTATKEVARFLAVPTGGVANTSEVLERAREQMAQITLPETLVQGIDLPMGGPGDGSCDELTGVASRLRFEQTLVAAFEQARAGTTVASVAIFDIDGLGAVNTACGEDAGDNILVVVAGRLQRSLGPVRGLVARLEGGRFGLVLPRVGRNEAVKICESARLYVGAEPVKLVAGRAGAAPEVRVTMSAGLVHLDADIACRFEDAGAVVQTVDKALAAAKRAGRNSMRVYTPAMKAAA
ncbi:MAG: GGDEF domain-containing protein [Phycisphaeraceae bacterium]|nr:GGDEF domain-containing protein [Phycisphaeraceae bacterium]